MEAFTAIEFDKVTAWPVQCAECDVLLNSRVDAATHEYETEHTCGDVPVPDAAERLMEAVTERKYFLCLDCDEGHMVLGYWDGKASLSTVN